MNVNFVKYGSELSDQQMEQFLRLEDVDMSKSSKKGMSIEDQESLNKMKNSVRLVNGHYSVGMLWKSEDPWLPDNRQMAEARLQSLRGISSNVMRIFIGSTETFWITLSAKNMPGS